MTRYSEQDFLELQRRTNEKNTEDAPESDLQKDIVAYCNKAGWPTLSFPRTKAVRKFLTPGWWDVTTKIPKGITLDMEIKRVKGGRMSREQILIKNMCAILGHTIHRIDTWKQFEELIDANTT